MKFLRIIFSRAFLTILALLFQVAIFSLVIIYLHKWFFLFYFVSLIISLLAFYVLIDKKEPAEFKIPWIIMFIFTPILGVFLFILYYNPKMTKKENRFLNDAFNDAIKFLPKCNVKELDTAEDYKDFYGISEYLFNTNMTTGFFGNNTTFFGDSREFFTDLKGQLLKAKKYILIEFFIIREGTMWSEIEEILINKVSKGVEVRVLFDYVGSFGNSINFEKKLKKQGITCINYNALGPKLSGRYNNRDHRKIVSIDGRIAYTGGINISDEYIGLKERFGKWKDSAIKLEGESALILTFNCLLMMDTARKIKSDYSKYLRVENLSFNEKGYVQPFVDGPKPFYNEYIAKNNFLNIFNSAKNRLWITTPYLIIDYEILSALKNAAKRGVDVRIVTPSIPDKKLIYKVTRSNYKFLIENGVKIFEYSPGFIHSKQILCDEDLAFVGTINLDYRSLVHHFECGVNLYKSPCIKDIENDFEEVFKASNRAIAPKNIKGVFGLVLGLILNIFSPMF